MTEKELNKANELLKELDAQKDSASYLIDTEDYMADETKIKRFFESKVRGVIKYEIATVMFKAAIEYQKETLASAQKEFDNFKIK